MKCAKCGKECYAAYGSNLAAAANPTAAPEMIPYCQEHAPWQASGSPELRIAQLEAELIAERARRIKAEEVVDMFTPKLIPDADAALKAADDYRAQYPRVEKENE